MKYPCNSEKAVLQWAQKRPTKPRNKLFCGKCSHFLEAVVFTTVLSKIYHQKKFILQVEMKSSFPR